ncbi:hypothetical protein AN958_08184, partial [Leucoagaricus sp. SymC.cos]
SSYFCRMLYAFTFPPFYTKYVKLSSLTDPPPTELKNNSKLWPYFKHCLGAIDGSHIHLAIASLPDSLQESC